MVSLTGTPATAAPHSRAGFQPPGQHAMVQAGAGAVVYQHQITGGKGFKSQTHRVLATGASGTDLDDLAVIAPAHQLLSLFDGVLTQHQGHLRHRGKLSNWSSE